MIIAVGYQWSDGALSAQSPDPLTQPRLSFTDLTYMGGFRLPRAGEGDTFEFGGSLMAYNPARNSLFVNSRGGKVAEVTIPAPYISTDVTQMPFASYLQAFRDPTEGHFSEIAAEGASLSGLLVHGDRLYGTGSIYYDALNRQVLSHFSHSTNLAESSFVGMSQVWETGRTGYVAGYLANVPNEWQSLLGGPALTGQCCIPIVTRTSFGPAAFAWNPASIGRNTAVPATPLLYYTQANATLGPWEGANERYGATTEMGGVAVIAGTRTALFIGRNGLGTFCYGNGTSNPALDHTLAPDGEKYCYDPSNGNKAQHAYPYRYQIWAYDLADFAAVKAGTKQPWDVVPYATWPFDFPTTQNEVRIGGVTYDAERQLLYVAQWLADRDGYAYRPIVHTLKINAPSSTPPPPPPLPSTSVSLTPNVSAPQPPGASITWSATVSGTASSYQYRWAAYANGGWTVVSPWSASQTFDWQPTTAAQDARMAVWVRRAPVASGEITADSIDAIAEYPFPIVDAPADPPTEGSPAVSSVALTSNLAAPQPVSSNIVWTATPTGGTGALVYQWFLSNDGGVTWTATGPWAASSQLSWTPTVANANYRVAVWVKRASTASQSPEAAAERTFAITEPVSAPVSSVTLTSNVAAPQAVSSNIVWTATPVGGAGALTYKWFISNDGGSSWTSTGPWASSNQFAWTPTVAGANYRVAVWVKRSANTSESAEASAERTFAITERAVESVTLNSNVASPQPLSTTIQWTATQAGGTGAIVYMWFVSNDGGATWTATGPWASSNSLSWTPTAVNANYRVAVWAKRASSSAASEEAAAQATFAITDRPVSNVTLTSNLASPQPLSATIQWTATQTGGTGAIVYMWFISNDGGATWTATGPWASSNTLSWTPTAVNANYRVAVWAKRGSSSAGSADAAAEATFAIGDRPVSNVTLTSNLASPQPLSTTIQWTATQTGGTGAIVYMWFISNDGGATWTATGPWGSSNSLSWTPTAVNANYRVAVWAKRASSSAASEEAAAQATFAITDRPVSNVTLTSNLASPQPLSATIQWTATQTGGTGAIVYMWFVSNDGGTTWTATGPWASSNTLSWTPTAVNANYRVAVWAKRASSSAGSADAAAEATFAIGDRPVSNVTLTSNLASPQPLSTTIQWTATQTGGTGAIVYMWFISNDGGATWTATAPWGSSNSLSWTPTATNANYRVAVWAKRASSSAASEEAAAQATFAITAGGPVSGVTLTSNLASPQPLASTINWTAITSGSTGALVYMWFISNDAGGTWTATGPWAPSNQLTWTPPAANPNYRLAVWVKRASNLGDSPEAAAEATYAITVTPN